MNLKKSFTDKILIYSDFALPFDQVCDGYYVLSKEEVIELRKTNDNFIMVGPIANGDITYIQKTIQSSGDLEIGKTYIDNFSIFENNQLLLVKESKTNYVFIEFESLLRIKVGKNKCKVKLDEKHL
jgi:hypothetical protein